MPPTLPSLASTYPSMNVDIVNVIESSIPRRLRLNCSIPDTVRPAKVLTTTPTPSTATVLQPPLPIFLRFYEQARISNPIVSILQLSLYQQRALEPQSRRLSAFSFHVPTAPSRLRYFANVLTSPRACPRLTKLLPTFLRPSPYVQ
jgi:hypothetical protein